MSSTKAFTITIITPESISFQGEASFVVVPGFSGEIGIMPGHANLIADLTAGTVRVIHNTSEKKFMIAKGVVSINPEEVKIFTTMVR